MRDGNTETMSLITTALLGVILTSLVLITIVGNVLVCLSVILVRKLRKPQNYLLVSLAVSDLFVALFVMPFAIVFELNNASWPLSTGICDLYVSGNYLWWNFCDKDTTVTLLSPLFPLFTQQLGTSPTTFGESKIVAYHLSGTRVAWIKGKVIVTVVPQMRIVFHFSFLSM